MMSLTRAPRRLKLEMTFQRNANGKVLSMVTTNAGRNSSRTPLETAVVITKTVIEGLSVIGAVIVIVTRIGMKNGVAGAEAKELKDLE